MSKSLNVSRIRSAVYASVCIAGLVSAIAGGVALAGPHRAHGSATPPASYGQYGALTDEHLGKLMHHLMARVDENQRARLVEIARRAKPELERFEQQAREARAPRAGVLLADVIDRQALEQIRSAEMQVAQERSLRVDQWLIEMASVLTPQQRARLLSELQPPAH